MELIITERLHDLFISVVRVSFLHDRHRSF
jgi:hypothetical protein